MSEADDDFEDEPIIEFTPGISLAAAVREYCNSDGYMFDGVSLEEKRFDPSSELPGCKKGVSEAEFLRRLTPNERRVYAVSGLITAIKMDLHDGGSIADIVSSFSVSPQQIADRAAAVIDEAAKGWVKMGHGRMSHLDVDGITGTRSETFYLALKSIFIFAHADDAAKAAECLAALKPEEDVRTLPNALVDGIKAVAAASVGPDTGKA